MGNRRNCEYLYSGTFGGMGFSLPAAIAASLLRPNTRILAVTGDGGLLMSLMELSTLAEQKSNAVIVVMNDSAYGMMWLLQHHKTTSLLNPVNFAKVAEGFGVKSWRVEEPGGVEGQSVRGVFSTWTSSCRRYRRSQAASALRTMDGKIQAAAS